MRPGGRSIGGGGSVDLSSLNGVGFFLSGEKILQKKLAELPEKVQKKVALAALRAGMTVRAREIRKLIPGHLKHIRKAIGARVMMNKKSKGALVAKVGGAVGMPKSKQQAVHAVASREHRQGLKRHKHGRIAGLSLKPGEGISANNIHWWLAGTKERTQKTTGRRTGRMPKPANKPVAQGFRQAEAAANRKIKQRLIAGIRRESAKMLKG